MNVRVTKGVSEELLQYYESMTKAILGTDEAMVKVSLPKWYISPKRDQRSSLNIFGQVWAK